jgi:DNA-binding LacI/PurR family transcriptional regulator
MGGPMRRVTIKDIALKAGVSKTTVSFAFNDPERISKDTYERVMRVASELKYSPDPVARSLSTRKSNAVGLLLPQPISVAFKNPYMLEILRGLGEVSQERGYAITIVPPLRGSLLDAIESAMIDGIVAVGLGPETQAIERLKERQKPFVTIDGEESEGAVNVGIDDRGAAREIMELVLASGARRPRVLSLRNELLPDEEEHFSGTVSLRLSGYAEALSAAGLKLGALSDWAVETDNSIEGARAVAESVLSGTLRPDALVCMSDVIALGVYEYCSRAGLSIPKDLMVTGFDDTPMARLLSPGLATVRQSGYQKGFEAGRLLFAGQCHEVVGHVRLPYEIVRRGSVA